MCEIWNGTKTVWEKQKKNRAPNTAENTNDFWFERWLHFTAFNFLPINAAEE